MSLDHAAARRSVHRDCGLFEISAGGVPSRYARPPSQLRSDRSCGRCHQAMPVWCFIAPTFVPYM